MDGFDLVIRDCLALVPSDGGRPMLQVGTTIVVSDGLIHSVLPPSDSLSETAEIGATQVVDATGMMAIPGLINGHTHAAMTLFRGSAEDVAMDSWFNDHIWPMEVNLTPEDVYWGTLLACAEMIRGGVTTVVDSYFFMEEAARAIERSGMRANLGWGFFSSQGQEARERTFRFAEDWDGAAGGRIRTSIAPHAPYTCHDADLQAAAEKARRLGVKVHIHAAETIEQTEASLRERGVSPVQILERTGILDAGAIIAHGAGLRSEDVAVLASHRDRVGVVYCPKGYLKFGWSRLTPVRELIDAGVPVGTGTDGAASNNTLDVLESLRYAAVSQKHIEGDATWFTTDQALAMATRDSALTVGLGDQVGALAEGHRADITLLDTRRPHWQPLHDPGAALLYSAQSADVSTVIIDGQVVMDDGALLTIDVDEVIAQVQDRTNRLTARDHGERLQTYDV